MAKELGKKENSVDLVTELIKIKVIPTIEKVNDAPIVSDFIAKDENYHFIKISSYGEEIKGSDFEIGERSAKTFLNLPQQYKVKKSPNKI